MLFDLSGLTPYLVAFLAVAVLAAVVSLTAAGVALRAHRRTRLARHESLATYYGRLVLAS